MTDNELLLAISDMMDKKLNATLQPIENRLDRIESKVTNIWLTLENEIRPRLNTIESCYTSTYDRYKDSVEDYEAMRKDIVNVNTEHSEKLHKLA